MSIDLNEMPEEYPSHMREEEPEAIEEEAAAEEVMDREATVQEIIRGQAEVEGVEEVSEVPFEDEADSISENRAAYEGLTRERLTEVVNDVLGEADPEIVEEMFEAEHTVQDVRDGVAEQPRRVRRVDVSQLPPGIDAETYVRTYQHTGTILNQATAVDGSYTGSTTDATQASWTDSSLLREVKQEKPQKEEPPPPTPEQIAKIKAERRLYHLERLDRIRHLYVSDMSITKDDLIITFSNGSHTFYHIDIEGEHSIEDAYTPFDVKRRMRGTANGNALLCDFIFDKNMNRLIVDKDSVDKSIRTRRDGRRILASQAHPSSNTSRTERSFVVIDKNVFLNSKGRMWKIKRKEHITYSRIKATKNMYKDQFDRIEQFLEWMRNNIEQVHPVEDYDIMYSFGGFEHHLTSDFNILLKFNDVTVSNSIEMEHYIGSIVTKSQGTHYFHNDNATEVRGVLRSSVYGTRLTFTPGDASKNYQHSHLTTSMFNFGSFCTGEQSYGTRSGYMTEYSIQEHVFRMQTLVTWESLEGGPHNKIENINAHGSVIPVEKNIVGMDRKVGTNYFNRLIYEINQLPEKFNVFISCFSIVNQSGVLRFVADYQMFFQKFMEVIDSDLIKRIHSETGEMFYTYNREMGTFHVVTDMESVVPEMLIKKAQKNMRHFTPIYIDGKYHTPRLTTRETGAMFEALRFSPEPNAMKEIAQYIMYKLTNKLEEHGNSTKTEAS